MADPPLDAGADQESVTAELPLVDCKFCGGEGTVMLEAAPDFISRATSSHMSPLLAVHPQLTEDGDVV